MSCFIGGGTDKADVTWPMAKECPGSELQLISISAPEHVKRYGLEMLTNSESLETPNIS